MEESIREKWQRVKISKVAKTSSGGTPKTKRKDYWDGNIPWINSGKLKDNIIKSPSKYITDLGLKESSAKLFPKGTTVIALTGATTGRVGLLDFETSTNQSVTGIFPNSFYNSKFLFYQLISLRGSILQNALGTAQPHINKRIVDETIIAFPPLAEQDRIVAKLDELFSRLDKIQSSLDKIPILLKNFRQQVLTQAVTGKLTETAVKEVKLGSLLEDVKYGTSKKSEYEIVGVPVLRIPNIQSGKISDDDLKFSQLDQKEFEKVKLIPGDILIIRSNGSVSIVGKSAIITEKHRDFSYAGYLIRLRCKNLLLPEFLNYSLQSNFMRSQIVETSRSTSGVNNINSNEIKNLKIILPSLEDQKLIVHRINKLFAKSDSIERQYHNLKNKIENLPQSILHKAFKGELVPQLEKDGDAQELLEEINISTDNLIKRASARKKTMKNFSKNLSQECPEEQENITTAAESESSYSNKNK